MKGDFFDQLVSEIQREYDRLDYRLEWRFLAVSKLVLQADPQIALVSANPGGDHHPPDHPHASCEDGCAYIWEQWKNAPRGKEALQVQVQRLFELLARYTRLARNGNALMERSLIGHFIPFRSKRLSELPHLEDAKDFGFRLWSKVLDNVQPKLFVTMDPSAYEGIGKILRKRNRDQKPRIHKIETGWGNTTAKVAEYHSADPIVKMVRLPHLSTYKMFGHSKYKPHLEQIFALACSHISSTGTIREHNAR